MEGLWMKKPPRRPIRIQSSRLLQLPPELRNEIWALVFEDVHSLTIFDISTGHLSIGKPLIIRVCRQIHHETREMLITVAPKHATHFIVHLKNFDATRLRFVIARMASAAPGTVRKFTFKVSLDNMFNHYAPQFRAFTNASGAPQVSTFDWYEVNGDAVDVAIEIRFDSKSFDVEYCRDWVTRYIDPRLHPLSLVQQAFDEAFSRHEAEQKNKKRKGTVRGMNSKKRARLALSRAGQTG